MQWITLDNILDLENIASKSFSKTQVLFKHSTRCSISVMAKGRLDRSADLQNAEFYYLDLLQHRDISNAIAEKFNVPHESPQILVIKNGECILEQTHSGVDAQEIEEILA